MTISSPLAELDDHALDVLVLGGGLTGCAVARALSLAGARVVLVEPVDFGWGASGRTSRLALRDAAVPGIPPRLARALLSERLILARTARQLVRPVPVIDARALEGRWSALRNAIEERTLRWLSRSRGWPAPRTISRRHLPALVPGGRLPGSHPLRIRFDALVDDRRLALLTALDARRAGAVLASRCDVTGLEDAGGGSAYVELRDRLTGETASLRTRAVVNATGAWIDRTRRLFDVGAGNALFPLERALHVVADTPVEAGVLLRSSTKRPLTVAPAFGGLVAGSSGHRATSDGAHDDDDDHDELVAALGQLFGRSAPKERTRFTAIRVAATSPGLVRESGPGVPFWSAVAGNPLLHRLAARRLVERLLGTLGPFAGPRLAAPAFLPGGDIASLAGEEAAARAAGLDVVPARWLVARYGSLWREVLREAGGDAAPLGNAPVPLAAEVLWGVRHEGARTVSDLLLRFRAPELDGESGEALASAVTRSLADAAGWTPARAERERARWEREAGQLYGQRAGEDEA